MRDQGLFFDVRKIQRKDDGEPRLELTAGTLDGIHDGRQAATGHILMYLPANAKSSHR